MSDTNPAIVLAKGLVVTMVAKILIREMSQPFGPSEEQYRRCYEGKSHQSRRGVLFHHGKDPDRCYGQNLKANLKCI